MIILNNTKANLSANQNCNLHSKNKRNEVAINLYFNCEEKEIFAKEVCVNE